MASRARCIPAFDVLAAVGLSFWWPLLRTSITGTVLSERMLFGYPANTIFVVVVALFVLVAMLTRAGNNPSPYVGTAAIIASVLASGSAQLMSASLDTPIVVALGTVSLAVLFVLLPVLWADTLQSRLYDKGRATCKLPHLTLVLLSYILSYLPDYLAFALRAVEIARPVVSPLGSIVCWAIVKRFQSEPNKTAGNQDAPAPDDRGARKASGIWSAAFLAALLFIYLINSLIVGIIRQGTFKYLIDSFLLSRVSASVAIAILLLAIVGLAGRATRREQALAPSIITSLSVLFLIGLLVTSLAQDNHQAFDAGIGIVSATSSLVSVLLYAFGMLFACDKRHPARFLTLVFTAPVLCNVAIRVYGSAIATSFGKSTAPTTDFWGIPSLVAGLSIAIALVLVSEIVFIRSAHLSNRPNRTSQGANGTSPSQSENRLPPISATPLCQQFGLSAREHDLVALLLQGNTFKKAAELLGLSEGTVQTYAKKIYRKAGVHSKQELIDLARQLADMP